MGSVDGEVKTDFVVIFDSGKELGRTKESGLSLASVEDDNNSVNCFVVTRR